MRKAKLETMTIDQLAVHFVEVGMAQDQALLGDEVAKFNQLYDRKAAILEELKSRPGDQRRVLISLYQHPNMQVRLNAAKATLAVAPEPARRALEAIRATRWQPQAGDAGMSLRNLDRGVFRPT